MVCLFQIIGDGFEESFDISIVLVECGFVFGKPFAVVIGSELIEKFEEGFVNGHIECIPGFEGKGMVVLKTYSFNRNERKIERRGRKGIAA
jgi:hypothetical protein